MKNPIYQVDAFTDKPFGGNPAGVCPLEKWLSDELMQKIALENNQAETAFFIREGVNFHIRWFTPAVEVDLCGHATLAAAHVLFNHLNHHGEQVIFNSRSGELIVTRKENMLTLNFPRDTYSEVNVSSHINSCFTGKPVKAYKGKTDYMLVFENEEQVRNEKPDLVQLNKLDARGVIITAKGNEVDFVSRFFAPQSGINEDPVTGSAHTTLTPYWSETLGKNELVALQVSPRQGKLWCKNLGDRIEISGKAVTYMEGTIYLPG